MYVYVIAFQWQDDAGGLCFGDVKKISLKISPETSVKWDSIRPTEITIKIGKPPLRKSQSKVLIFPRIGRVQVTIRFLSGVLVVSRITASIVDRTSKVLFIYKTHF